MSDRGEIRSRMRARRGALDDDLRDLAARRLCSRLSTSHFFMSARRIAAYLPNDGEIDLRPVIALAWQRGREVFLPVLRPGRRLEFARYAPDSQLQPNRFGIPEPVTAMHDLVDARALDLVLMPLVAFDVHGNRIGMGGGFYDRSFAFLRRRKHWRRPRLVGVAFDFQRAGQIEVRSWDVPAWRIVTDSAIYPIPE